MHPQVRRRFRQILALSAACVLAGCASYSFKVDAVKGMESASGGQSYRVVNDNPDLPDDAPAVLKATDYVRTALSSKGLYEAPGGIPPEMIVEVDFGIEAPRVEERTYSVPVYRTVKLPDRIITYSETDSDGKTRIVKERIPGETEEIVVGWQDCVRTEVVSPKYLRITARESPEQAGEHPPRELWSIYVTNEDGSDNLDEYLPLLVSAAMDSIDQNSSSAKTVVLSESDDRVTFVKRGM